MSDSKYSHRNFNAMCSSWISFAFAFFFFYIIGDVIFGWWHQEIWVWIILGFFLIGAITTTIRFFVYRTSQVAVDTQERYYGSNYVEDNSFPEKDLMYTSKPSELGTESITKFCKFCGIKINERDSFCSNCGAEIEKE